MGLGLQNFGGGGGYTRSTPPPVFPDPRAAPPPGSFSSPGTMARVGYTPYLPGGRPGSASYTYPTPAPRPSTGPAPYNTAISAGGYPSNSGAFPGYSGYQPNSGLAQILNIPQATLDQQNLQYNPAAALNDAIAKQLAGINTGLLNTQAGNAALAGLISDNASIQQRLMRAGSQSDIDLLNAEQDRTVNGQRDYIRQLYGIDQGDFARNINNLTDLRGFIARQYGNGIQAIGNQRDSATMAANQGYNRNYRATASDATARGAFGSQGVDDQFGDLRSQLSLGLKQAQDQYQSGFNDLELARDKGNNDINQREGDLRSGQARSTVDFNNQNRTLDGLANEYGIKRDQVKNALDRGLQSLGMDTSTALQAISNAQNSASVEAQAQAAAIANQAIQLGLQSQSALPIPPPRAPTSGPSTLPGGHPGAVGSTPIRTLPTVVNPTYGGIRPIQGRY